MKIRELQESDIPTLRKWHQASGFDYPFPDLLSDEFARVSIVADENDEPVQAFPAKKTIEMYLLANPAWGTPRQRLMALELGHEEMRQWLESHGWDAVNCWLPPQIEKAFGKRLQGIFGWVKSSWSSFSRKTAAGG